MRYLGIDYGGKRVGAAISDESGKIAFPHAVLENNRDLVAKVLAIVQEKNIGAIVLGESRNFRGEVNVIMEKITPFQKELEETSGLPVFWEKEFMTTQAAERIQGAHKGIDASAAALILQSYLDRKHNG